MKTQMTPAIKAAVTCCIWCSISCFRADAQEPSPKQEPKPAETIAQPARANPFKNPGKGDIVNRLAGKPPMQCWSYKCDNVLWEYILKAASEAGILETNKSSAVVRKDKDKIAHDKAAGTEWPGPYVNGAWAPARDLNVKGEQQAHSITDMLLYTGEILGLHVINGGDEMVSITYRESDDCYEIAPGGGKILVISDTDKGVYHVWLIEKRLEHGGPANGDTPPGLEKKETSSVAGASR
jgi:hypothetical protein